MFDYMENSASLNNNLVVKILKGKRYLIPGVCLVFAGSPEPVLLSAARSPMALVMALPSLNEHTLQGVCVSIAVG